MSMSVFIADFLFWYNVHKNQHYDKPFNVIFHGKKIAFFLLENLVKFPENENYHEDQEDERPVRDLSKVVNFKNDSSAFR